MKTIWGIIKDVVREFQAVPTMALSAATAYYAAFSIGPLLVMVVAITGWAFGKDTVQHEVVRQVESFVGPKSAQLIQSMMSAQMRGGTITATLIGACALIFGATGVFGQLQASLNMIYGVKARANRSRWLFVRDRVLSLAMVLAIGFLLLVSMALSAFVTAFTHYIGEQMALPDWIVPAFDNLISLMVFTGLFALIFKVLPDVKLRWRDVSVGAFLTALLFAGGKFLLSVYLRHEISSSAYGAGSAFIVILLYVFYASLIFYLGAEFTKVYAKQHGSQMECSPYAVPKPSHA